MCYIKLMIVIEGQNIISELMGAVYVGGERVGYGTTYHLCGNHLPLLHSRTVTATGSCLLLKCHE